VQERRAAVSNARSLPGRDTALATRVVSQSDRGATNSVGVGAASVSHAIILPSGSVTIKATAAELFQRIAATKKLFVRGGAVVSVVDNQGNSELKVVTPPAARSLFEGYATLLAYRSGHNGELVLKPSHVAQEMATALLESEEAQTLLPKIAGLINCPVMVRTTDGLSILGPGYDSTTGFFVTGGTMPPTVPLSKAIKDLKKIVKGFDFQSKGDRSRALAAFITPALKLGGHISGNVPADIAEADKSQAGKTFRQRLVASIYGEVPCLVTCRNGGVGSVDESLNTRLIAGRPFILLDNFRGKLNSPHIEALLTAEKAFPVRVPHSREVLIDPSRVFVMLTSNGVETTRDFANRGSIVRIRKRPRTYKFRKYPEGNVLAHVRAHQPHYLGAVFAIIKRWHNLGRKRSDERRHDFPEWAGTLDWIVQEILDEAPLMEGHEAAQERVSNSDLTFLRALALAVVKRDQLDEWLFASDLYNIADACGVDIPGLREPDKAKGARQLGTVMGRLFSSEDSLDVDEFTVKREKSEEDREDGGTYIAKTYRFEKTDE
jgi:hypothetical protein